VELQLAKWVKNVSLTDALPITHSKSMSVQLMPNTLLKIAQFGPLMLNVLTSIISECLILWFVALRLMEVGWIILKNVMLAEIKMFSIISMYHVIRLHWFVIKDQHVKDISVAKLVDKILIVLSIGKLVHKGNVLIGVP
jgi:hypothetical protein